MPLAELDSVCCDKTATLPELRPLLKDADARVRVSAARSVSLIEGQASPEVLQVLVTALASEDSFVSWSAAWTLKRLGPKAAGATEALAGALKHRHQDTRLAAAIALGEIGPGAVAAVPALEETLGGQGSSAQGECHSCVAGNPRKVNVPQNNEMHLTTGCSDDRLPGRR